MRQPGASAHGTAAERLWRNTAAGGLPSEGSAFSGTLLRMLQISGTTVAELIDAEALEELRNPAVEDYEWAPGYKPHPERQGGDEDDGPGGCKDLLGLI